MVKTADEAVSDAENRGTPHHKGAMATPAQRRYLKRGLSQPGGKLPLFDRNGAQISRRTVESCIAAGWAEPWFVNPVKPDWLVCRLTATGYRIFDQAIPAPVAPGARPVRSRA
jgi:hypothetical protein